jgi:hypothetical protein
MNIRKSRTAFRAFGSTIDFAERFFARHEETRADNSGTCGLFHLVPDDSDAGRRHDAPHVTWTERSPRGTATFEGFVTVRPALGKTLVALECLAAGPKVTKALLDRLADHIEAEWKRFVIAAPAAAMCNARNRAARNTQSANLRFPA